MEISFYTHAGNLQTKNGYGVAAWGVVTTLQKLGHTVPFNKQDSEIQLNFCQPSYFADMLLDRKAQHKIGYTAWESTQVPEDWPEIFAECDEVWATSEWVKRWYLEQGINCTKVYPHGIDPIWTPKKREIEGPMKFLHHGEPAPRKGGQIAYDAFIAAFGKNNMEVQLVIKGSGHSTIRRRKNGTLVNLPRNVTLMNKVLEDERLVQAYHAAHVMVYPSYGEGFGFIPLQAMATGMPTICTGEWADYENYLGNLSLDSSYKPSHWKSMHPGDMCEPDFDDLVAKYRYAFENYDTLAAQFHKQSFGIHKEYDWAKLTEKTFENLVPKTFPPAVIQ